jgi:hypothetical protein
MVLHRPCDLSGWYYIFFECDHHCSRNPGRPGLLSGNISLFKTSFVPLFFVNLHGYCRGDSFMVIPIALHGMDELSSFTGNV